MKIYIYSSFDQIHTPSNICKINDVITVCASTAGTVKYRNGPCGGSK